MPGDYVNVKLMFLECFINVLDHQFCILANFQKLSIFVILVCKIQPFLAKRPRPSLITPYFHNPHIKIDQKKLVPNIP